MLLNHIAVIYTIITLHVHWCFTLTTVKYSIQQGCALTNASFNIYRKPLHQHVTYHLTSTYYIKNMITVENIKKYYK